MHAINAFEDLLGSKGGRSTLLQASMRMIDRIGRGVIVLIRDTQATIISDMLLHRGELPKDAPGELRDYGVGWRTIVGLEGYGLRVLGRRAIEEIGPA
jgi:3,4-dihydroxy 2-butanone 4-phosphate synthase/GTP cyclohydrolase II